jgi:hypothetical protein
MQILAPPFKILPEGRHFKLSCGIYTSHFLTLVNESYVEVKVEVEVNLQPTVSRPFCLGAGNPSGTRDQFFLSP